MNNITYYPMSSSPMVAYDLFGYKNIESDTIPFSEQIRNSKDAKATEVIIDFSKYKKPGDIIIILDNGGGMNDEELVEGWLNIGTNNKSTISTALGGKGIGRFSLFRVAGKVTILSKKSDLNLFKLVLDQEDLSKSESINSLKIPIERLNSHKCFPTTMNSGTVIILEHTYKIDFEKLYLELHNINNPSITPEKLDFKIKILKPSDVSLPSIMKIEDALKYSNFNCTATYKGGELTSYNFMGKFNNETIYINNLTDKMNTAFKKIFSKYEIQNTGLGEVKIILHNFYFDKQLVSYYKIPQKQLQNNFLNVYQGISVYRENFQIYGHGKNDWLKLAEKRVAAPTKNIDNKLTFGYVLLTRPGSDILEETTNREGFISGNGTYLYFKESVNYIISLFNKDRITTAEKIKKRKVEINKDTPTKQKGTQTAKPSKEFNNTNQNVDIVSTSGEDEKALPLHGDTKDEIEDETEEGKVLKPKKPYNTNILIDSSFICPLSAPLKIKQIIYELQNLRIDKDKNLYAVALLLRSLIDISTQYARENLQLMKVGEKPNLNGDIQNVINYYNKQPTTREKHLSELQKFIKEDGTIKYFNGIVHDYDYRPTYDELKKAWNKFEFYITKCIYTKTTDKE